MTDRGRSGRRAPAWLAPGIDRVRAAREELKLVLRSLGWRARYGMTRSLYLGRRMLRPEQRKRSVLFLHHSYYHFYYLAKALRARGWDAISVSMHDPDGGGGLQYHGEDLSLFSTHQARYRYTSSQIQYNIRAFFALAKRRFTLLHFAGDGHMSFFPENWGWDVRTPWDIVEWKEAGGKLAYTVSGCNSGIAQSSITSWSRQPGGDAVCDKCAWQHRPDICNDAQNLRWGEQVDRLCDLIFAEGLPALDYMHSPRAIREPTTMCLDPEVWSPDLRVPGRLRLPRAQGELLIFHAVGNFSSRTVNGRNIKGTHAVRDAVERLNRAGIRARLIFATDVRNTEVRFLQVQCDVIVDQLNFGRYGALAREGMMLGKPTICYINPNEPFGTETLSCLREVPLVSATEETVFEALKDLLLDVSKRESIGRASRAYAVKWHSADACAARYEEIYDALMSGKFWVEPTVGRNWAFGAPTSRPMVEQAKKLEVGATRKAWSP